MSSTSSQLEVFALNLLRCLLSSKGDRHDHCVVSLFDVMKKLIDVTATTRCGIISQQGGVENSSQHSIAHREATTKYTPSSSSIGGPYSQEVEKEELDEQKRKHNNGATYATPTDPQQQQQEEDDVDDDDDGTGIYGRRLAVLLHCLWSAHRNTIQGTTTTVRDLYYTDRGGGLLFKGSQVRATEGIDLLVSCLSSSSCSVRGGTNRDDFPTSSSQFSHNHLPLDGNDLHWSREKLGFTIAAKSLIAGNGFSFYVSSTTTIATGKSSSSARGELLKEEEEAGRPIVGIGPGKRRKITLSSASSSMVLSLCSNIGSTCSDFEFTQQRDPFSSSSSSSSFISLLPFVLIIEKEATMNHLLLNEHILEKYAHVVLICGKGYPCHAATTFLQRLHLEMGVAVPIYGMVDGDPHGLSILSTYAFGGAVSSSSSRVRATESLKQTTIISDGVPSEDTCRSKGRKRTRDNGDSSKRNSTQNNTTTPRKIALKRAIPIRLLLFLPSSSTASTKEHDEDDDAVHTSYSRSYSRHHHHQLHLPRNQCIPLTSKDTQRAESLRIFWKELIEHEGSITLAHNCNSSSNAAAVVASLSLSLQCLKEWLLFLEEMMVSSRPSSLQGNNHCRKYELQALTAAFGNEYWTAMAIPRFLFSTREDQPRE